MTSKPGWTYLLRRKTGALTRAATAETYRITATCACCCGAKQAASTSRWMASNADYAHAMAHYHAREQRPGPERPDLLKWAQKLEDVTPAMQIAQPKPLLTAAKDAVRYMGGLR